MCGRFERGLYLDVRRESDRRRRGREKMREGERDDDDDGCHR